MTRAEAPRILEESFARPSSTPTLKGNDRDAYLAEEKDRVRACLIDPVEVSATASDFEWAKDAFGRNGEMHRMIAIARHSMGHLRALISLSKASLVSGLFRVRIR